MLQPASVPPVSEDVISKVEIEWDSKEPRQAQPVPNKGRPATRPVQKGAQLLVAMTRLKLVVLCSV